MNPSANRTIRGVAPFAAARRTGIADDQSSGVPSLIADPAPETEVAALTTPMEGDVVQLKSGGPKMTVDGLSDEAGRVQANCSWFNDGIRMSDLFELHSLRNLEDGVPKGITVSRMLDLDP